MRILPAAGFIKCSALGRCRPLNGLSAAGSWEADGRAPQPAAPPRPQPAYDSRAGYREQAEWGRRRAYDEYEHRNYQSGTPRGSRPEQQDVAPGDPYRDAGSMTCWDQQGGTGLAVAKVGQELPASSRAEALVGVLPPSLAEPCPVLPLPAMLLLAQGTPVWPLPAGAPSGLRTGRTLKAGRAGTMSMGLMQAGGRCRSGATWPAQQAAACQPLRQAVQWRAVR